MGKANRYFVGVDLGGTNIRSALADCDGQVLQEARRASRADHEPEETLAEIRAAIEAVIAQAGARPSQVAGIGIGLPGIMDSDAGVVHWSPNFPLWKDVPVAKSVGGPLGAPVAILNDAKCAALGELHSGAGAGARHMVMITLGTGIGGAFVVDGRLLIGPSGSIGEVGHHTIDPSGPRCGCGNFGCWEQFCGRDAIVDRALRFLQAGRESLLVDLCPDRGDLTPATVAEAAAAGDLVALQVLAETGFYVGVGVANLINMLNPERFVIGGGIAQAGEPLWGPLRRTVAARAVPLQARIAELVPSKLGDEAGVVGALVLAREQAAGP